MSTGRDLGRSVGLLDRQGSLEGMEEAEDCAECLEPIFHDWVERQYGPCVHPQV